MSTRGIFIGAAIAAAIASGCSGGGGGSALPGPGPSVAPSPTPQVLGVMQFVKPGSVYPSSVTYSSPSGPATVIFSCGCTGQAGTGMTDAAGSYTLTTVSTATPTVPNPTYTIMPGRNYIAVATDPTLHESWQLEFAGNIVAHNLALSSTTAGGDPGSSSKSDIATAAGALYVYEFSKPGGGSIAFDGWNFNDVQKWVFTKLIVSPNVSEQKLLTDITTAMASGTTLFPDSPGWNSTQPTNLKIKNDLVRVSGSGDVLLPAPCPTPGGTVTCANPTPAP